MTAELIGGPCDGAEIEDDSVSTYVIPWDTGRPDAITLALDIARPRWRRPQRDAVYEFNPATGNYHFKGFME